MNVILPDAYVSSDGILVSILYYWAMSCMRPSSWLVLSDVACSFLRTHVILSRVVDRVTVEFSRRYFQHAHFIPVVDVGKRSEY